MPALHIGVTLADIPTVVAVVEDRIKGYELHRFEGRESWDEWYEPQWPGESAYHLVIFSTEAEVNTPDLLALLGDIMHALPKGGLQPMVFASQAGTIASIISITDWSEEEILVNDRASRIWIATHLGATPDGQRHEDPAWHAYLDAEYRGIEDED